MNCDRLVDLLVDYFDGHLKPEMARRLESHLEGCPNCVDFIDTYRHTGDLCRRTLKIEMPRAVKSTLFEVLRAELQSPSP